MTQLGIPHFDGATYEPNLDHLRLTGQIRRVYEVMFWHEWVTLPELAQATGDPHASVSAQLRNLRKARYGGHTIERRHLGHGLFAYKLVVNK